MSFLVSTSSKKFFVLQISLTRFLFRPNAPANKGLSWILGTLTLLSTNRNSSVRTCLWLLKFLTRVFIYSNLISSPGTTTLKFSPITGDSLRSPGILALGFLGISNFACFRLGSRQPPLFSLKFSNRFRNLGEARASLLSFFLTMVKEEELV